MIGKLTTTDLAIALIAALVGILFPHILGLQALVLLIVITIKCSTWLTDVQKGFAALVLIAFCFIFWATGAHF